MTRISMAGAGGILLDARDNAFNMDIQEHIWSVARDLIKYPEISQVIPGVNNLLVTFDVINHEAITVEKIIRDTWESSINGSFPKREVIIPVTYGGEFEEDLTFVANFANLTEDEVIVLHSESVYRVAAIGSMPGFAYLTGLDVRLAVPRRASPRVKVKQGAVCIGGGQAGILPCSAPTGWHILGWTDEILFDASRHSPCLFQLGDFVRFRRIG